MAKARSGGRTIPVSDGYIAATAAARGMIVATRDTAPFEAAAVLASLVAEAEAKWDAGAIQADIELSIARRLLVRAAHQAGQPPEWDYVTPSGEEGRWCRASSDYNEWSFRKI